MHKRTQPKYIGSKGNTKLRKEDRCLGGHVGDINGPRLKLKNKRKEKQVSF